MKPFSNPQHTKFIIERAQPWLGTIVSMHASGLREEEAHRAMDAAFAEIGAVHRLMSFHDHESDVSRLNRYAVKAPINIDQRTVEVLRAASAFSVASEGCFDVTVGAELVECGVLPKPHFRFCKPYGSWRDIEITADGAVRFHRPLWIDLGGIAKGYAVDRAIEILRLHGATSCLVNAGGDIRVAGDERECIPLAADYTESCAAVELSNGSVASSSTSQSHQRANGEQRSGSHLHGIFRSRIRAGRFACVIAETCMVADALTKIVLAAGRESVEVLKTFGAAAHFHEPCSGWLHFGAETEAA